MKKITFIAILLVMIYASAKVMDPISFAQADTQNILGGSALCYCMYWQQFTILPLCCLAFFYLPFFRRAPKQV